MPFTGRTTEELIRIAAAGGGFRLNGSGRQLEELIRIAAAAGHKGVRIIFTGLDGRTADELVQIASAGKGSVFFED